MNKRFKYKITKIITSNATILVLNVYLPYQSNNNVDEYQAILGKIQAISDSFESSNIFIIGDFNADLIKTSLFSQFLNSFISECHFIPSDIKYLPPCKELWLHKFLVITFHEIL